MSRIRNVNGKICVLSAWIMNKLLCDRQTQQFHYKTTTYARHGSKCCFNASPCIKTNCIHEWCFLGLNLLRVTHLDKFERHSCSAFQTSDSRTWGYWNRQSNGHSLQGLYRHGQNIIPPDKHEPFTRCRRSHTVDQHWSSTGTKFIFA